jgi:hypothetical protein
MAPFAAIINLLLIGLIWWCAHRLTWDCTHIDEQRLVSAKGLLSAAGLEQRPTLDDQARDEDLRRETEKLDRLSLSKRWERFRERRRKRPQQPGLVVVWFSLAALPIFGLGESLIPIDKPDRRTYVFWLAACYVGCALGLLLTTSFLGLRRYLRQRKMEMPGTLAGVWLGLGGAMIVLFLVVAALLPRPYSETPIADITRAKSKEREASRDAVVPHSTGGGNSNSGGQTDAKGGGANDSRTPGQKEGQGNNSGRETKNGEGGESKDGQSSSEPQNDQGRPQAGQRTDDRNSAEQRGSQGSQPNRANQPGDPDPSSKQSDDNSRRGNPEQAQQQGKEEAERLRPEQSSSTPAVGGFLSSLLSLIKWLVFILLALLILALLVRGGLKYLANFMLLPRQLLAAFSAWWERFWRKRSKTEAPLGAAAAKMRVHRPFKSFSNPFGDGSSEGRSTEELIGYSFAALEAWANDCNHGRRADETPLEFAARLSHTFEVVRADAPQLAILVVRVAYANGKLPDDARDILERFWNRLTAPLAVASAAAD